jgi:hypothetical protein
MNTGETTSSPVGGAKTSLAGPVVVRMVLGARMRRFREASGITCADSYTSSSGESEAVTTCPPMASISIYWRLS